MFQLILKALYTLVGILINLLQGTSLPGGYFLLLPRVTSLVFFTTSLVSLA
jgi:hypothetical protein